MYNMAARLLYAVNFSYQLNKRKKIEKKIL